MDNNFSTQVKEIISYSREEALRLGNDFIGTEHLVLGLIRDGENTAMKILKALNVDLYELRKEIELAVKDKTGKNISNINSLPLTKQAEKVIRITVLEAKTHKSPMVESEHLMLSILKNKENIATQILNQFDVDYDMFKSELGYVKQIPKQISRTRRMKSLMRKRNLMLSNALPKEPPHRPNPKLRYWIILEETLPGLPRWGLLIRS
jgi:ATP-dependent Clp protease ATP-binding subunit ClpC